MPKKSANTNKTAHVMNLISKNTAAAPAASPEAPPEAPAAAPPPSTPSPVVLPSLNADLEVSSQIKSALEDLLEEPPAPEASVAPEPEAVSASAPVLPQEEVPAPAPEAPVAPEPEAVSAPEPVLPQEEVPAPAPEASAATEPEAVSASEPVLAQEEVPAPAPEAPAAPEPEEEPIKAEKQPQPSAQTADPEKMVCVNIMQSLVEESVQRYIDMFGLCSCPRCVEDVKAIALNNLVPKYIVTPEKERSPRVIIYNERYHAEVTAQILRACKTVMDNPLHD